MKSVLSDIFLKKGLYLEGLDNLMITITTIDVSPDLRHAKVYLTFINCSDSSEVIIKKLNRNAKNYKFIVGKEIRLKRIPNIRFFEDAMYNRPIGT